MNIENVEKKLREANSCLANMRDQESRAFGDKEPFDFALSAFLNAARTVDYRLCHIAGKAIYKPWRKRWNGTLSTGEKALIKFMVDDRNVEVHEIGSVRQVKQESVPVRGHYSDASGTLEVFSTPLPLAAASGVPPGERDTVVYKPTYFFRIEGTERKATDVCAEYLALLKRMVTQFKADHS
jgi:hypothetical protein